MRKRLLKTIASCMLALGVGSQAVAATVYNYTGNYFDFFWDSAEIPYTYTSTMRVEGSISTTIPLESNRPYGDIKDLVVAYSFSDGVQTIRSAQLDSVSNFSLSTDINGNIDYWDISVVISSPAALPLTSMMGVIDANNYEHMGMGMYQNDGGLVYGSGETGRTWYDWAYAHAAPGEWIKEPIPPVPLPPAVLLFGSAIAFIAFVRRKKSV